MAKRLAIVPARGGSKRIRNKNIKLFCGNPVINYTINTLQKSKLFSKIHVSTESKKIAAVCKKKIKFDFFRPKRLSGDKIRTMAVINFVVNKYKSIGEYYDEVWIVYPCSPLIETRDYRNISKLIKKFKYKKTVLTVCEHPSPTEFSYKIKRKKYLLPKKKKNFFKKNNQFEKSFYETGAVVAIPKKNFKDIKDKPNFNNLVPYVVDRHKSIDINTLRDWNFAEIVYKSIIK